MVIAPSGSGGCRPGREEGRDQVVKLIGPRVGIRVGSRGRNLKRRVAGLRAGDSAGVGPGGAGPRGSHPLEVRMDPGAEGRKHSV
jgi:hypothetical protein